MEPNIDQYINNLRAVNGHPTPYGGAGAWLDDFVTISDPHFEDTLERFRIIFYRPIGGGYRISFRPILGAVAGQLPQTNIVAINRVTGEVIAKYSVLNGRRTYRLIPLGNIIRTDPPLLPVAMDGYIRNRVNKRKKSKRRRRRSV